jgi:invasion protein IalB
MGAVMVGAVMVKRLVYLAILIAVAAALAAAAMTLGADGLVAGPGSDTSAPASDAVRPSQEAAAPASPPRTETVTYDSWTVTCRDTVDAKTKKVCSGMLQIADQKSGQVLLVWIIGRNTEGALLSVLRSPTGVLVQNGVELKIGGGAVRKLSYTSCDARQCEASVPMDEALSRDASAAQEAVITIYVSDGRGVSFNVPLKGADKAIAALGR